MHLSFAEYINYSPYIPTLFISCSNSTCFAMYGSFLNRKRKRVTFQDEHSPFCYNEVKAKTFCHFPFLALVFRGNGETGCISTYFLPETNTKNPSNTSTLLIDYGLGSLRGRFRPHFRWSFNTDSEPGYTTLICRVWWLLVLGLLLSDFWIFIKGGWPDRKTMRNLCTISKGTRGEFAR